MNHINEMHPIRDIEQDLSSLGKIVDASVNEIFLFDTETFLFTYLNRSALVNIGYTMDEMKHMHPYDIKPEFTDEEFAVLLKPLIENKIKELVFETIHQRKDKTTYYIEAHLQKISDDESEQIAVIVLNITKRKQLEEELKQRNELYIKLVRELDETVKMQSVQMVKQSRLVQMGEMISMIAHQWRQPLNSISVVTSTLSVDVMLDNYKKEFFLENLHAISQLAQHLSSTIEDFRSFFMENKHPERIKLSDLIKRSISIINPSYQTYNISLKVFIENDIEVSTYANEVNQVLLNLLKNSEDVLLQNKIDSPCVSIFVNTQSDNAIITVEDNGGGISDDVIEKIFDPYFSTKNKKEGMGLGLYMSKIIIENHCHGSLSVSNVVKGALFTINLPLNIKEKDV